MAKTIKASFSRKLLMWYKKVPKRDMPWRNEKEPYKIWLSEIILQQTRVEQGIKYYERFIETFPNVNELAKAKDETVFKLWEGLGYYSRCKNILHTARYISRELNGIFPKTYDEILSLKGIGPYTAAAISSFAYGLQHAVVDGNVYRVLARYFGESVPIDSTKGKNLFSDLAHELLYKIDPALYNQAIMDFGAMVCKPKIPECQLCIFKDECVAFKNALVNKLPIKEKQLTRSTRWFYNVIFKTNGYVIVNRRSDKDIWQGLYEFYLFEAEKALHWDSLSISLWLKEQLGIENFFLQNISPLYRQQLTHQNIHAQFISIELPVVPESLSHLQLIKESNLKELAFPRVINTYLQEKIIQHQTF